MKTIIKYIKRIFETFTVFDLGWDIEYGFNFILLETMLDNKKATIDNLCITRALLAFAINKKRLSWSIFYSKNKIIKFKKL